MSAQPSITDFIAEAEIAETVATNAKTWDDLATGDFVEVWYGNGLHFGGWCAGIHPVHGEWEIEAQWRQHGDKPRAEMPHWRDAVHFGRFSPLWRRGAQWRWVRHDPEWSLSPTPDEMAAWLREMLADVEPYGSLNIRTAAGFLWPHDRYDELKAIYAQALLARFPDPTEYAADKRWHRCKLPKKVAARVEALIDLGPDARVEEFRNLHWPDGPNHDAHLAFMGVNDDYEIWHVAHTDDPKVLVALAEEFGLMWMPRKREGATDNA